MTMQNELKPNIHMDIPAGESNSISIVFPAVLNLVYGNFYHYHSLRNVTLPSPTVSEDKSWLLGVGFSGER